MDHLVNKDLTEIEFFMMMLPGRIWLHLKIYLRSIQNTIIATLKSLYNVSRIKN